MVPTSIHFAGHAKKPQRSFIMSALLRRDRLDDLFPEFFRRLARPLEFPEDAPASIRIDVTENDKDYQVRAEMPGAKKEDIRVTVDGNFVSVSAEVKREKEEKS
jgi:HSP20 family protein